VINLEQCGYPANSFVEFSAAFRARQEVLIRGNSYRDGNDERILDCCVGVAVSCRGPGVPRTPVSSKRNFAN